MNKLLMSLLAALLLSATANAQTEVEMADAMRADGKIYVVVGIILIVLVGLMAYLFFLDRKIKKLESLLREHQPQTK
jgi:CcmD family protein